MEDLAFATLGSVRDQGWGACDAVLGVAWTLRSTSHSSTNDVDLRLALKQNQGQSEKISDESKAKSKKETKFRKGA